MYKDQQESTDDVRFSLEFLQCNSATREALASRNVRIWQGDRSAYWRQQGYGYTKNKDDAGVFIFRYAYSRISHAAPEKQIMLEIISQ